MHAHTRARNSLTQHLERVLQPPRRVAAGVPAARVAAARAAAHTTHTSHTSHVNGPGPGASARSA
eukprot:361005-Chlamydomonas_euryale.AAC.18